MSRLFISLFAGLVWAGHTWASDLQAGDPQRIALVALARGASATGLPPDARLSLRRAWVDGPRALVCAVVVAPTGQALVHRGRLLFKRVQFHQQGQRWRVAKVDRVSLSPAQPIDAACGPTHSQAILAAAERAIERQPTAAGRQNAKAAPPASCVDSRSGDAPEQAGEQGVVRARGRSLFHTAPDLMCRMGAHIVEGDRVHILQRTPGWACVSYTHPITGATTRGWVRGHRVAALN